MRNASVPASIKTQDQARRRRRLCQVAAVRYRRVPVER